MICLSQRFHKKLNFRKQQINNCTSLIAIKINCSVKVNLLQNKTKKICENYTYKKVQVCLSSIFWIQRNIYAWMACLFRIFSAFQTEKFLLTTFLWQ